MRAPDASTRRRESANQDGGRTGQAGNQTRVNDTRQEANVILTGLVESIAETCLAKYEAAREPEPRAGGATGYLLDSYGLTMTPEDVAHELHQSAQHVRALCREGQLPAVRVGNRWHVSTVKLGQIMDAGVVVP